MPTEPNQTITFNTFILSLVSTAAVHFGDIAPPGGDKPVDVNLQGAAQMIEILEMLQQKTHGNLMADEEQFVEQTLYELRMRFVEASRSQKRIIVP
jgi:hypothetical protein